MIDTISFRISITPDQRRELVRNSTSFRKRDHKKRVTEFKIYSASVYLPSYNHKINIILSDSDPNHCKIELSLPKFYYDHNVYLLYGSSFPTVYESLYHLIISIYPSFPHYSEWSVQRVDVCYAWKFISQQIAESILSTLFALNYPRKEKIVHDTSVMWFSRLSCLKFYLKKPEYYYHDFKRFIKEGQTEKAYNILNVSDGVLRFEVTMRHQTLSNYFDKKVITPFEITEEFCLNRLKFYFDRLFKGQSKIFMDSQTVFDKLLAKYTVIKTKVVDTQYKTIFDFHRETKVYRIYTKALQLYQFYCMYYSKNKVQRDLYIKTLPVSTRDRKLRELAEAGVGAPDERGLADNIKLEIKSDFAVNQKTEEVV